LHARGTLMWPVATTVVCSVSVTSVSPTKMADVIDVRFMMSTLIDPRNHMLGGAQIRPVLQQFLSLSYPVGGSSDSAFCW